MLCSVEGRVVDAERRDVVHVISLLTKKQRDVLLHATRMAYELGAAKTEYVEVEMGERNQSQRAIVSALQMPSGNRYVVAESRFDSRLSRRFSDYTSVKSAAYSYFHDYKWDATLSPFIKVLPLDDVQVLRAEPMLPMPGTVIGVVLFDYFKVVERLKAYREVLEALRPLAERAGAITTGVEDLRQAVEEMRAALDALLSKVDALQSVILRLADRTMLLQKLLEGYRQPELQPVKVVAEQVAQAAGELVQRAEELRSLPSFARGNPWLDLLSRRGAGDRR